MIGGKYFRNSALGDWERIMYGGRESESARTKSWLDNYNLYSQHDMIGQRKYKITGEKWSRMGLLRRLKELNSGCGNSQTQTFTDRFIPLSSMTRHSGLITVWSLGGLNPIRCGGLETWSYPPTTSTTTTTTIWSIFSTSLKKNGSQPHISLRLCFNRK